MKKPSKASARSEQPAIDALSERRASRQSGSLLGRALIVVTVAIVAGLTAWSLGDPGLGAPPDEQAARSQESPGEQGSPDDSTPKNSGAAAKSEGADAEGATARKAQTEAFALQGRTVDELEAPIAGAQIDAFEEGENNARPIATTRSDRHGRWRLAMPKPGPFSILIEHPEFAPPAPLRFVVATRGDGADAGTVRLRAGLAVRGRLFDPDGRAVVGAELTLRPQLSLVVPGGARSWTTLSDERGAFAFFGLNPDNYRLAVRPSGTLAAIEVSSLNARPPSATPVDIRVPLGSDLRGLIQLPSGRPRPGTRAWLAAIARDNDAPTGLAHEVSVDADGSFLARRLAPGRWRLAARGPRGAGASLSLDVPSPRPIKLVLSVRRLDLRLSTADASRLPRRLAYRFLSGDAQTGSATTPLTAISLRGPRLVLEAIPIEASLLEVRAPGFAPAKLVLGRDERAHLRLEPGARVHGVLLGRNGQALEGVRLVLVAGKQGSIGPLGAMAAALGRQTSAANGAFAFESLPEGPWRLVRTDRPGVVLASGDAKIGADSSLRVSWPPPLGALEVTAAPELAGQRILVANASGLRLERRFPANGRLDFEHLPAGRYTVRPIDPAGRAKSVEVLVGKRVRVRVP